MLVNAQPMCSPSWNIGMITATSPWCIAPPSWGSLTSHPSPGFSSPDSSTILMISSVPISDDPT